MTQLQNRLLHIHAKAAEESIGLAFATIGSDEGITNKTVFVLNQAMTMAITTLGSLRHLVDDCIGMGGEQDPLLIRVVNAQNYLMGAENFIASDLHYCAPTPLTDALVELRHVVEALDFRVRFTPEDF